MTRAQSSAWGRIALVIVLAACAPASEDGSSNGPPMDGLVFGFGRPATDAEVAALDIDIMPDGTGLPAGGGTALQGSTIYAGQCAACHGTTGVEGPNDRLVGGPDSGVFPFGDDPETRAWRTIGSYWPYATTVFDYVRRAMPQTAPGSLSDDQVYALTAFLLFKNGLIGETDAMTATSLPKVTMPAQSRFESDDRLRYHVVR